MTSSSSISASSTSSSFELLHVDAFPETPWKNGLGTTRELLKRSPNGGGHSAPFSIRISVANVTGNNLFSVFDGIDRVLTPFSGNGFSLACGENAHLVVAELKKPVEDVVVFRGEEQPIGAVLHDGAVRDFNVMTSRADFLMSCAFWIRADGAFIMLRATATSSVSSVQRLAPEVCSAQEDQNLRRKQSVRISRGGVLVVLAPPADATAKGAATSAAANNYHVEILSEHDEVVARVPRGMVAVTTVAATSEKDMMIRLSVVSDSPQRVSDKVLCLLFDPSRKIVS